jgi:sorbitol-6-phosphate 2-dehydrogenase
MEKIQRLKDKVAIITGGAQGLGEALAERVVNEGGKIVITDINIKRAQSVAKRLNMIAARCDVTKYSECKAVVEVTMERFGRIDVLISNAAIWISGSIEEFNPEKWEKVINVNLCGAFNIMKAVAPVMKKQNKGSIIQINSKSGKKGSFNSSAYPASKFGGIGLIQSLALELAQYQIRVNAICPGNMFESPLWTNSMFKKLAKDRGVTEDFIRQQYIDKIPLKRGCSYEDVANVLVFLASDEANYMTGQAINVTGGQEMR